ncbi:MAG: hypothetical protein E7420_07425 [Ruminococcaceae bacterium]|nr:hypothetical protein [Oscillospiraceae bacterium]
MKPKICLSISKLDSAFEKMLEELKKYADVDLVDLDGFSLKGYDIFIGKKLSEEALATADRLKAVFAYKTGVDDFPLSAMQDMGITLVNSHIDADYIAEYSIGLGMSLLNRITESDKKLRKGIWRDSKNPYWTSIFDVKIGLLGFGHIGRSINRVLRHNFIETYTIDRGKQYDDVKLVSSLDELCEKTNLIVISLPKTAETNCLFDERRLKLMKDKYIVNVGRSNCIDQKALYNALSSGYLAGAAIDTWDSKPKNMNERLIPYEYPFETLDNIVLSPHQAMQVEDGHERYVMDTLSKVIAYITDGSLSDVVDLTKGY